MKKDATLPANEEAVPNEPTVAQLMAMLIEMRKTDHDLTRAQLKQTQKRENKQPPMISVYNPQGEKDYPMPPLAREVLMPWSERPGQHALTWEEVELVNRVMPGEYVLELLDGTPVQCCVLGTKNSITGRIERLAFMGQRDPASNQYSTLYSKERRTVMPPLVSMLHQILDQQGVDYADILPIKERTRRTLLPADDPKRLPVSVGE